MRRHGELAKYVVEKCRCEACSDTARTYGRERTRAIHRPDGYWEPYVSARETRKHLKALSAIGIGPKTVAELSGISHGAISKILYGDYGRKMKPSRRIRRSTAEKILAVHMGRANGGQRIPSGPTWRLLDDLISRGYTRTWLAQRISGPNAISLQISHDRVFASTARKVEALHYSLRDQTGPGRRSRWDNRRVAA